MHGKCSCAKFVGCFHSSDTSKMRTYGMDLETSRPRNSSSSAIHTAARFRHCCIQLLSMKRWCQLNSTRVAHDARPALSSYQNKCFKPFKSQQWHLLWCLKVLLICLHYDSTDWNLWSGQRRQPISWAVPNIRLWAVPALVGPIQRLMCVTVWINVSVYILCFVFKSSLFWLCQCCNEWQVKAIRHKVQCLLCSEVAECVNFTSRLCQRFLQDKHIL